MGRTILNIGIGLFCLLIVLLALSWGNHRVQVARESNEASASSLVHLVQVNGHKVNVYAEGEGSETLVFMAGSGTSAPTLDFKPLWASLSDHYRIAVVERAGYGFSEIARGISRDIDSMLAETRQSLEGAGERPPYVLVPHSMSVLEAVHWANKYPDEIKAIVGIDPAVPQAYERMQIPPHFVLRALSLLAGVGMTRWSPSAVHSPAVESGYLDEDERHIYAGLVHRRTLTTNMLEEMRAVVSNAQTVLDEGLPAKTPMYFFISNGEEVGVDGWRELLADYTQQVENGQYRFFDTGHYIHHYEAPLMAEIMTDFIDSL